MSKQIIPCGAAFATVVPDTLHVFDTEFRMPCVLPPGVQIAAFQSSTSIIPRGLGAGKLLCEKDLTSPGSTSFDIVVRVEQDKELAEAVAKDLEAKLIALGYVVRVWLCALATHRYAYAYVRAVEKNNE